MSHIVTIKTEVRDAAALSAACRRLGLTEPEQRTVQLYDARATGLAIQLPGWEYPVVCDTASGTVHFDNFEGRWGDRRHLNRVLQLYAVEKAKLEAKRRGHSVRERELADGSIRLTIGVEG